MKKTLKMLESEVNEIKRLLDEQNYDEIYTHLQSQRVLIDVLNCKLDNLIEE